tara:strand:+ start:284 stop:856 length:573 start_codon:yes stop_codon:yes gene_type:complete
MNPFKKFNLWFSLAKKKYPYDHTAFALGTSDRNNQPHVRMVLLKLILEDGFVFFTNLNSQKGKHFNLNKNLSMCFYWENLNKQIRIIGKGSMIEDKMSDKYFSSRPRGSQIGAWVSKQSSEIPSKSFLKQKEAKLKIKFEGFSVPRPSYWCGIKIMPKEFEFWQQGDYRLHDREVYRLKKNNWTRKILSP